MMMRIYHLRWLPVSQWEGHFVQMQRKFNEGAKETIVGETAI